MTDLTNLAPYLYSIGFALVLLIIVALLLAPALVHLRWERRQRRRRY